SPGALPGPAGAPLGRVRLGFRVALGAARHPPADAREPVLPPLAHLAARGDGALDGGRLPRPHRRALARLRARPVVQPARAGAEGAVQAALLLTPCISY